MPSPKIVFDNVHGNIRLYPVEKDIIDTAIFQRLRRISHLALAEFVFPGATHSRFAHSLGTLYTISEMLTSLKENNSEELIFPESDIQVIRLVGLLHDVGHLPFSHVLDGLMEEETGLKHDDLTVKFVKESEIGRILDRYRDLDQDLLINVLEKNFTPTEERKLNYVSLIDGNLDADKLDYLKRDSVNTGVGYGSIDVERILKTISIDDNHSICIMNKGRLALENLCIARYHMFQTVYFHKSVVAFETMLSRLYEQLTNDNTDNIFSFNKVINFNENEFIKYDDCYVWYKILNYSGDSDYIKELSSMLLKHQSIKLVVDDPKLVDPDEIPERRLYLLNYERYQKMITESMPDFDLNWLFIADSRTKFRKSDYAGAPIKVQIEDEGGKRFIDISDLEYSIMHPLKKEFSNFQVYTHPDFEERLRGVLKDMHLID